MKTKFRKTIDCIISKDDKKAKTIIKEAIQTDERYIAYKNQLKEYGLNFHFVTVEDKIYEDLENVIKEYHPEAQLKIIDNLYLKIAQAK